MQKYIIFGAKMKMFDSVCVERFSVIFCLIVTQASVWQFIVVQKQGLE